MEFEENHKIKIPPFGAMVFRKFRMAIAKNHMAFLICWITYFSYGFSLSKNLENRMTKMSPTLGRRVGGGREY
jgi:hypothetical protein